MTDEQKVATEGAENSAPTPVKPAEKPSGSGPASPPSAPRAQSGGFRGSGLVMALILGVVIGVLACVLVSALVQKPQINTAEAPIVIKEPVASEQAGTSQALASLLKDTGGVADQVVSLLREKNFGKAEKKLDELAAMFDRAKEVATAPEQQALVSDLTAGIVAVRTAVDKLAAKESVKRARTLRQKIAAAVKATQKQG